MRLPDGLLDDLRRDEGFESKPYRDTKGKLTIGYGCLLEDGISEGLARHIMEYQADRHSDELAAWMFTTGHPLTDHPQSVQRALCNMAFQLGIPKLTRFRKMFRALSRRDYDTAAYEALDSKWAREDTPKRARRVADLIRRAED